MSRRLQSQVGKFPDPITIDGNYDGFISFTNVSKHCDIHCALTYEDAEYHGHGILSGDDISGSIFLCASRNYPASTTNQSIRALLVEKDDFENWITSPNEVEGNSTLALLVKLISIDQYLIDTNQTVDYIPFIDLSKDDANEQMQSLVKKIFNFLQTTLGGDYFKIETSTSSEEDANSGNDSSCEKSEADDPPLNDIPILSSAKINGKQARNVSKAFSTDAVIETARSSRHRKKIDLYSDREKTPPKKRNPPPRPKQATSTIDSYKLPKASLPKKVNVPLTKSAEIIAIPGKQQEMKTLGNVDSKSDQTYSRVSISREETVSQFYEESFNVERARMKQLAETMKLKRDHELAELEAEEEFLERKQKVERLKRDISTSQAEYTRVTSLAETNHALDISHASTLKAVETNQKVYELSARNTPTSANTPFQPLQIGYESNQLAPIRRSTDSFLSPQQHAGAFLHQQNSSQYFECYNRGNGRESFPPRYGDVNPSTNQYERHIDDLRNRTYYDHNGNYGYSSNQMAASNSIRNNDAFMFTFNGYNRNHEYMSNDTISNDSGRNHLMNNPYGNSQTVDPRFYSPYNEFRRPESIDRSTVNSVDSISREYFNGSSSNRVIAEQSTNGIASRHSGWNNVHDGIVTPARDIEHMNRRETVNGAEGMDISPVSEEKEV